MPEPISITIGGEAVALPPILHFIEIERCWDAYVARSTAQDRVRATAAGVAFVAALLLPTRPDLTVATIKSRLRINRDDGTDETAGLLNAVDQLIEASGIITKGEIEAARAQAESRPAPPNGPT